MSTQRKAWNEAMRSAGAVLPPSSGSGASPSRRESIASRSRRKRRENARKSSLGAAGGSGGGGINALEEKEYRVALHMDILEGVVDNTVGGDDDDEYDEFAELDDDDDNKKKKRKRKSVGGTKKKKGKASAIPKYLKARSLASILIEEASRSDSVAKQYVDASVRRLASGKQATTTSDTTTTTTTSTTTYTNPYPARKFCPVTGLYGEYTEPKTGISYASLSALEQIRERPPPWMNVGSSTSASYWEAVKSLQNR